MTSAQAMESGDRSERGLRSGSGGPVRVRVSDVDIAFWSMVTLMIKASFAAAIAVVVTSVLWMFIGMAMFAGMTVLGGALGALAA